MRHGRLNSATFVTVKGFSAVGARVPALNWASAGVASTASNQVRFMSFSCPVFLQAGSI